MATYTNLIPTMTSATTPSGVASAGSIFSGIYDAWNAMDGTTNLFWATANSVTASYIQYKFATAKVCNGYAMEVRGSENDYMPSDWTLEASNTGTFTGEETVLDTQTGISWNSDKKEYSFVNTTPYLYYRIDITDVNGGTQIYMETVEFGNDFSPEATLITGSATVDAHAEDATGPSITVYATANIKAVASLNEYIRSEASLSGTATVVSSGEKGSASSQFLFVQELELSNIVKIFTFVEEIEQIRSTTIIKRIYS